MSGRRKVALVTALLVAATLAGVLVWALELTSPLSYVAAAIIGLVTGALIMLVVEDVL